MGKFGLRFSEYLAYICRIGYDETALYFRADKKNLFGRLIAAAIAAVLSPILLQQIGGIAMASNIALVIVVVILSAVIGWFGWYFILLVYNIVTAPVKLHNNNIYALKRLSGIPSDPIETTLSVVRRRNLHGGKVCGIEITNSSDNDISFLSVRLRILGLESRDRSLKPLQVNSFNNEFASGENCEDHTIPARGGNTTIYLARAEIDKDVFLLNKTLELPTDNETATYRLVLAIDGYIGDKQMKTIQYEVTIIFYMGGDTVDIQTLEPYVQQKANQAI